MLLPELLALIGECPAPVLNTSLTNGSVYKVDVQMSSSATACASEYNPTLAALSVTFSYNGAAVGHWSSRIRPARL